MTEPSPRSTPQPTSATREFSPRVWRTLFEQAPVGIAIVSPSGEWLEVNGKLVEIVGYPREVLLGLTFQDVTHPDDLDADLALVRRVLDGEIPSYTLEKRYVRRDDSLVPVRLTVSLVRGEDGEPEHFISVVEDVSERREADAAILSLQDALGDKVAELEAANQELESFSYSVSHDLRAPLRAIDGFSRILEEELAGQLGGDSLRYLGLVRQNARRMGVLIDALLAFSRVGQHSLDAQQLDLTAQVRHVYSTLVLDHERPPPRLELAELPPAEGDRVLLQQVWSNLLSNAIKFSRDADDAVIEVGFEADGDDVRYFVRDHGVGFDMRYSDKLFGVFQRLHREDEFEGTGVGLALVQRIVHRHDGHIWADAEPGRGATFYFTLGSPTAAEGKR